MTNSGSYMNKVKLVYPDAVCKSDKSLGVSFVFAQKDGEFMASGSNPILAWKNTFLKMQERPE